MYFVDNGSAVPVMPQVKPVSSATPQFFTEGGNGTPPTYPGPDWFNIFQLELLNVLKEAQINPDKANHTQLVTAMKKLFLDASSNGSDIPDKAAFLSNLGLKSAAQRDVGTGTNQIPDMNSFTSGPGWMKFPSGIIIQYGNQISSASGSVAVSFPIPFPTQCFGVTGAGTDVNFANIAGCQVIDKAVFYLSAWFVNAGPAFYRTATNISWIAVGI